MNIAYFYPSMDLGGQQTQTLQQMIALKERGHAVSWVYQRGSALVEDVSNVGIVHRVKLPRFNLSRFGLIRILNRFIYYRFAAFQLRLFCKKNQVDVLISANTPDSIACNRVVSKMMGVLHFRAVGGSLKQTEPHWLEEYQQRNIDAHISGYFGWPLTFEELKSACVPSEKLFELNFAVDTDRFFPLPDYERMEFRASLGIRPDEVVLGWIGRIAVNMQVWNTLALAKELGRRNVGNVRFLFVGGGPDEELLHKQIEDAGLQTECICTGWVPYQNMNSYVNAMDIVPLLEEDPQGGSIVREAMAAGRIALSVNGESGTQAWFMQPGSTVLVESNEFVKKAADQVDQLVKSKELRDRIGRNARVYAIENLQFKNQAETIEKSVSSVKRLAERP